MIDLREFVAFEIGTQIVQLRRLIHVGKYFTIFRRRNRQKLLLVWLLKSFLGFKSIQNFGNSEHFGKQIFLGFLCHWLINSMEVLFWPWSYGLYPHPWGHNLLQFLRFTLFSGEKWITCYVAFWTSDNWHFNLLSSVFRRVKNSLSLDVVIWQPHE